MGLIFLILVGAMLGWISAIIMRSEESRDVQLNIAVGIAGAMVAGIGLHPLFGTGSLVDGTYSVDALVTALLGAVGVLILLNVMKREVR